jgi:hypothetical protein
MFEASIPAETLKSRAYSMQKKSVENNRTPPTPPNNNEIPKNQVEQEVRGRKIFSDALIFLSEIYINSRNILTYTLKRIIE